MNHGGSILPAAVQADLVALYNVGNWADLAAAAERATKRYPRNPFGWRALGKALLLSHRLPEAIEALSHVVKLAPSEADGFNDLGNAFQDSGRKDEAEVSYRRATLLKPPSAEAFSNLGRVLCELRRFDEAVACCQRAIAINPNSYVAHNNLGNAFSDLGQLAKAEESYRRALELAPRYLDALVNLGTALRDQGRWMAAKSTYMLAVQMHPTAGVAYNALGRLLSRLSEDDDTAMRCLERAIALNAGDGDTYIELGNVLLRKRRTDAAFAMYRHAQQLRPFMTWRANQEKAAFSALFIDTPLGGSTPLNYLAGRASYDRHFYCLFSDTPADVDQLRERADVVFNMICNADDGRDALLQAIDLVTHLDRPIINHPRVVLNTDRESVARCLVDIPYCVVPKTCRVSGSVLAEASVNSAFADFHPPMLVRVAGKHGGDDFTKVGSWTEVAEFVAATPAELYYLIEYIDYRSFDGYFRKYRVIFIDGEIFPYHLAIHDDWKVHHFRTDMANHAWMRHEEAEFLDDMSRVLDAPRQDALRRIAGTLGLDYGGVDFGLDRDSRIVVFEANASMLVHDEKGDDFAYKNPYIERIKRAFDVMLTKRVLAGRDLHPA
jgi:tetratricopeptide (TPR) repeat protein